MIIIKDTRADWKYIFVVVIVAVLAGAGVLWFMTK